MIGERRTLSCTILYTAQLCTMLLKGYIFTIFCNIVTLLFEADQHLVVTFLILFEQFHHCERLKILTFDCTDM